MALTHIALSHDYDIYSTRNGTAHFPGDSAVPATRQTRRAGCGGVRGVWVGRGPCDDPGGPSAGAAAGAELGA